MEKVVLTTQEKTMQEIRKLAYDLSSENLQSFDEEIRGKIFDILKLSNKFISKHEKLIQSGMKNYNDDIYLNMPDNIPPEQSILLIISNAQRLAESVESIINKLMQEINDTQNKISSTEVTILSKARSDRPEKNDTKVKPDEKILNWIKANLGEEIFNSYNKEIPQEKYDQMILSIRGWIDDQNAQINMNMTYLRKFITDHNQTMEYNNAIIGRSIKANLAIINSFKN